MWRLSFCCEAFGFKLCFQVKEVEIKLPLMSTDVLHVLLRDLEEVR